MTSSTENLATYSDTTTPFSHSIRENQPVNGLSSSGGETRYPTTYRTSSGPSRKKRFPVRHGRFDPITTSFSTLVRGVVVKSPLLGINKFEKAHGLPHDYLNVAITARGAQGAFQRLKSGMQLSEFYAHLLKLPTNLQVDGKQLWTQMMAEASTPNLPIIKLIKRLRELERYRIAALTNNFQIPAGKTDDDQEALGSAPDEVKNLFDEFIESSQVGLRKPDPKFFEYALKLLKVRSPKEVVFLDDLGINLKAAEKLGINTIKVGIHDVKPALEKLEKFLPDVDLSDIIHSAAKL
ncbi:hypothetical protein H4Q26_013541 [Puccinia striiformis f. sp. tritici PST-130]|nr:hypothetical protein H4Q26_013541 [Puccinia striiformis f. sp. tritici PST-130]